MHLAMNQLKVNQNSQNLLQLSDHDMTNPQLNHAQTLYKGSSHLQFHSGTPLSADRLQKQGDPKTFPFKQNLKYVLSSKIHSQPGQALTSDVGGFPCQASVCSRLLNWPMPFLALYLILAPKSFYPMERVLVFIGLTLNKIIVSIS